jgi:2-polyprenyl-6-methoxyphenol hydroxylase-like FAD-dependent oxidoreductase
MDACWEQRDRGRVRVAVIGAGPTGLFLGAALHRRGHAVTLVDRDGGPDPDGTWERRGVMQFRHAHAFRGQVAAALAAELPEALSRWAELGAEELRAPDSGVVMGTRSRRITFERALRASVAGIPGIVLRQGHVRGVCAVDGVTVGLDVDGEVVPAELVVDASGRSGKVTRTLGEREGFGGRCGIAYVDREYRLHPGAEPGPLVNPVAYQGEFDGYQVIVFPHEHGIFSVLVIRPTEDPELKLLRHQPAFEAACAAIPALAAWTDPDRSAPCSEVLPGGELLNHYRGQSTAAGRPLLTGLVAVGDAVGTTTPVFGRGVALALGQCRALLAALDEHGPDVASAVAAFDAWCEDEIAPWVRDHIEMDAETLARWRGEPLDLDRPLTSNQVLVAGQRDPAILEGAGPYLTMQAGPASLRPLQEAARRVYETGWRMPYADGPSRAELARIVSRAV